MAVRILTARAHRLFGPMAAEMGMRLKNAEGSILLVPEQLTLTAEQELMKRLNVEGLFLIDVMSPSRLCEHVLEAAGRDGREPLNDAGRRMAISQALERLEEKLPYYGSVAQRRGFVEKLDALITDMQRGGLTPEALADYAATLEANVTRVPGRAGRTLQRQRGSACLCGGPPGAERLSARQALVCVWI